jgi:phosphate transport system substrate-binding protein
MIKHIRILCCILLPLLMASCQGGGGSSSGDQGVDSGLRGSITVSGAWALYPMTVKWAEEFRKVHPGVRIDISAGGAGKGFTDALSGMVDLGMFSRGFTQAELDLGVWYVGVAKDAVIPVVNENNPYLAQILRRGITKQEYQKIYLSRSISTWHDLLRGSVSGKIHVYTRSDACGAAEMWGMFLGRHQEDLQGTGVFGDPGIANAVKNDVFGMGYNNVNFVYDLQTRKPYPGLAVIPLDLNGNGIIEPEEDFYGSLDSLNGAIRSGLYPSPPARPLYFVAKEKPTDPVLVTFLQWILVHGQQYLSEAGYVQLPEEMITGELEKLN